MSWGIIGKAAHTVSHGIESGAKAAGHAVESGAKAVGNETGKVVSGVGDEAKQLGSDIGRAGSVAAQGISDGASWAGDKFEEGAEKVEEGAVALGKFASAHACSAAIGTALGAAVMELSTDGEEEGMMAALAIALVAAKKAGGIAAVQEAATLVANGVTTAVWAIPGVASSGANKNTATAILKYCIVMAAKENMSEVEVTGGQYLTGVFLTVLTGFICSGELPGGFKVWQGEGSNMDFLNH